MRKKRGGQFSDSLFCLELQIKTLLEEVGGDSAIELLDALCHLNKSEQKIALKIFKQVVNRIAKGDFRLCTQEDQELKDFEEGLYKDIMNSMREATLSLGGSRLEVIEGGKVNSPKADKTPIDINKARQLRNENKKTLIN